MFVITLTVFVTAASKTPFDGTKGIVYIYDSGIALEFEICAVTSWTLIVEEKSSRRIKWKVIHVEESHSMPVVQTFTWYAYRVTCLQRGVDLDRLKSIFPPLVPPPLTSAPPSLMSCCCSSLNNDDAGYSTNTHHARKESSDTRLMPIMERYDSTANEHCGQMQSRTWTVMDMLCPARCVGDRMHLQEVMRSAAGWLVYAPWYFVTLEDGRVTAFLFDRGVIILDSHKTKRAAFHEMPIDSIWQIWRASWSCCSQRLYRGESAYVQHLLISYPRSDEQVGTTARCDILWLRGRSVRRLVAGRAASTGKMRDWNIMLDSALVHGTVYETQKTCTEKEDNEMKSPRHFVGWNLDTGWCSCISQCANA